ncbi:hypothetical protein BDZ91DRAFT_810211 [Kalaharituber pfeilii]|nr:hypothetical protein BDZ91DRAFT_810211 [Kalaharituber pfeilii]
MPPSKWKRSTEVIEFERAAREEYLTGCQKRRVQRTKKAQEEILRENHKKDLEEQVKAIEVALKPPCDLEDGTEEDGKFESEIPPSTWEPIRQDAYVDEERFTTIMVEPIRFESSEDEDGIDKEERWKNTEKEGKKPKKPKKKKSYPSTTKRRDMNKNIKQQR